MSRLLNELEPEDVRFLLDFSELKDIVIQLLGDSKDLVNLTISYDSTKDAVGSVIIRPMVTLTETGALTEEQRHHIFQSGLTIDEPFTNGDYVMGQIFGQEYTITQATKDEDGSFFTIEMPYRFFIQQKKL